MDLSRQLVSAMAAECKRLIESSTKPADASLPCAMQPKHLKEMCNQIVAHAERGRATKLHRWIGFIQCAMLAHRLLDLDGLKAMFRQLKKTFGESNPDVENLLDHLDPTNLFELDIGGEA